VSSAVVSLIALICVAVFSSITAPLILAHRTEKMHRDDRLADYERQDLVAAKAAQAARDLAESQREIAQVAAEAARLLLAKQEETVRAQQDVAAQAAEAARLLLANNERVARTQTETNGKLDVIHTLVNSNMTAAMQSEFDAVTRELAMMREVASLKQAAGHKPDAATLAAIEATEARLHELDANLADRKRAQDNVGKQGTDITTITTVTPRKPGSSA